jgi:hypothetical protein
MRAITQDRRYKVMNMTTHSPTHRFIVNPWPTRYNGADQVTHYGAACGAPDRVSETSAVVCQSAQAELAGLAQDFSARRFQQGETSSFK